ncbi:MAG: bifunctional phosphopantothenoylcysteine decarboxylase/phosphopantothenate--cysteine ligase CoaBC [Fulvimarina sp.]|nr:bifunctional phosphopantothenoylcysteine decarboxylase/phosphopantothenate--cysteine ligase CoaBC [Fulvimarina sp.]
MSSLSGKRVLLIVGGGIAAYKCLDLIRRLRERGAAVTPVMTGAAAQFVTPLSVGALAASRVYSDLFDREDEQDVGHIRLAREHDLVLVAPATADRMARVANGLAEDLAGAILLATRAPVLMAPAMNPAMWDHPATRRNHQRLLDDRIAFVGPGSGEMAEKGEAGTGRMAEPLEIVAAAEALLAPRRRPLAGLSAIVTSGPTHEPIDPVRYIANRSSGRQGHAIAAALRDAGARVTLVSGPVTLADPRDIAVRHVETAAEMLTAVEAALPADIAVFVAAVADWRVAAESSRKIKKTGDGPPALALAENPDILSTVGHHDRRPGLVIGFAAETDDLLANARGKLARKGADAILANDVSPGPGIGGGVMGGAENTIRLVTAEGVEDWPTLAKEAAATRLADWIAARLGRTETQ